jgi:hypothetical protein
VAYRDVIMADSPVAYWRLNEASGNFIDQVSSRAAVPTGSPTRQVTGALGGDTDTAAQFNGTTQYAEAAYAAAINPVAPFTVEAWVYLTAVPTASASVLASRSPWSSSSRAGLELDVLPTSAKLSFQWGDGSNTTIYSAASPSGLNLNQWYHVVCTHDGSTGRLYLDGLLVASTNAVYGRTTSAPMRLAAGRTESTAAFFFPGRLDEIAVYATALSLTKVQAHHNAGLTPPDTTPPTAPASLTATVAGPTGINLSWPAATDAVGVAGYRVERKTGAGAFAEVAQPTGLSFSDSGLTPSTAYDYRVRAIDAANNLGPYSPTASATTAAPGPDSTPPTAPASLTATPVSQTRIDLSWPAATDNVGVTGYRVERCTGSGCTTFTEIAQPAGLSYSDTTLSAGVTYRYRVRARDAAGNLGPYSPIQSATTVSPDLAVSLDTAHDAAVVAVKIPAGYSKVNVWQDWPWGRWYVRGAAPLAGTAGQVVTVTDYEAPLGTPYAYKAAGVNASGVEGTPFGPVSFIVPSTPYDYPWLQDLTNPSTNVQVIGEAVTSVEYEVPTGVHWILGRADPVTTSDLAHLPVFEIVFTVLTVDDWYKAHQTLSTGRPILFRTVPQQMISNLYLQVTGWSLEHISRIRLHEPQRFTIRAVQVARPDATVLY